MQIKCRTPHIFPTLTKDIAHIWATNLDLETPLVTKLYATLNGAEKERADKFLVPKPRRNFIVARATLRMLLANYLKISAQEIVLQQNEHGKLYLKNSRLQFNLSHSHELALFAFAYDKAVGIDVEFIRKEFVTDDIVKRFFSKHEIEAIFALPKIEQQQAFFSCWARKEAFIKALGVGIFYPLDQFDVAVTRNEGPKELYIHDAKEQANNWHLYALNVAEDYAAALVTRGEVRKYDCLLCSGNFSIA